MKLLLTLDFPPAVGGIQTYLSLIVAHTFTSRDCVVVGAPRPKHPPVSSASVIYCSRFFAPVAGSKLLLLSLLIRYLLILLRTREPVDTYCGNVYAALVPWVFSRLRPLRYRVFTYGTELIALDKHRCFRSRILIRALRGASTLYALGPFTESLVRRIGLTHEVTIEPPRIVCTPQHVADALMRRSANLHATPTTILSVGRLVPHKGHHVLIEALALLPDTPAWDAVIVGEGPRQSALHSLISNRGLRHRVKIRSAVTPAQLQEEFRRAALFVLPSLSASSGVEGFGIVLLEAMADAVAVIASRCGGITDVVDGCGVLVGPGDPEELARAIQELLLNPESRMRIAEQAAERVMEHYVWR